MFIVTDEQSPARRYVINSKESSFVSVDIALLPECGRFRSYRWL